MTTPTTQTELQRGQRTSAVGLVANIALAGVKLAAGILGHSYALVADAVESSLDVLGSYVVWTGLRIAARPADAGHPYGHGRAESLAGMIVALMLFAAGLGIAIGAVWEMRTAHQPPAAFTLIVLLGVVLVKEILYRFVARVGRAIASSAVLADSWHHRSDAITSLAAAIGISIALLGGPPAADEAAALVAAAMIMFNGWRLVRQPVHELMDTQPDAVVAEARARAAVVPGVAAVEKVLARKSGLAYLVDMHVEVDPQMPVHAAHQLAHDVKDAIRAGMPHVQDVLVHIEPHAGGRSSVP